MEIYLRILSALFFVSFRLGILKNSENYFNLYFLKNLIRKGDSVIDIGANLGYYSVFFSKLIGNDGKLYSVEPVKQMLEVLRRNLKGKKNVTIFPYALGEENKTVNLGNDTVSQKGYMRSGSHKIIDQNQEVDVTFNAEMKKGSELFKDLEKIDFIKCDIEGYEWIVLKEMESVIVKHRPSFLIETRRENRRLLLQFFKEKDFTSYILQDRKLVPATPDNYLDIFVFPNEKISTISSFIN